MNKVGLTDLNKAAAIPVSGIAKDIAHMTRPSEGLRIGHLHNILYAINQGPMIPRNDDTHYVTYSTGDTGTLADLIGLHNDGLLSDGASGGLSDKGVAMLTYLNATQGPSNWQKGSNGGPALAQA